MNQPSRIDEPVKSGVMWPWIIGVVVVIAVAAIFIVPRFLHGAQADGTGGSGKGAGQGPRTVPVVASKSHKGNLKVYLNGLGTVTPLNTVALHTRVDGQLDKVYFTEGQVVKAGNPGDLLVELDPRPFQVQLTQAEGAIIRDQALLENAKRDLDRYVKLLAENLSVTQQQVDTQRALVAQYEGQVKTDQGQIDAAKLNLVYCKIYAPVTGRIGLRLVDAGNIVHASDANPLAVITQIQPISVIFTIAEDNIPAIQDCMKENPTPVVEAWDRDLTHKLATGKLLALDNQVDPTNGTVKIKGIFDNQNFELFPNEFVNARLLVQTLHDKVLVPSAAVQRGPDSIFVYVVKKDASAKPDASPVPAPAPDAAKPSGADAGKPGASGKSDAPAKPDGTVVLKKVTIGVTEGDQTVIESGLSAGELVVTDGIDKLQDGSSVVVREKKRKGMAAPATEPSAADSGPAESAGVERSTTQPAAGAATQPAGAGHHHHKPEGGAE